MSHSISGSASGITPGQTVTITVPDDGDSEVVNSVNIPFQRLSDFLQYAQTKHADVAAANSFTNAAPIALSGSLTQTIGKTGTGNLNIQSSAADIVLYAPTGQKISIQNEFGPHIEVGTSGVSANCVIDMTTHRVTGVDSPTAASDAVPRDWLPVGQSSSCSAHNITGTYANVFSSDVTITPVAGAGTYAKPVLISVNPAGGVSAYAAYITMKLSAGGAGTIDIRIKRDSSYVAETNWSVTGGTAYEILTLPWSYVVLDMFATPNAAHAYNVEIRQTAGSDGLLNYYILAVQQLL